MKAIAAMSQNRVIGRGNKIPWHIPADFRWFKQCTSGQVVLMGRKTFESLGKPLPNRRNLVVSRGAALPPAVEVVRDLAAFDPEAYRPLEVWLCGGAELYEQLLPRCTDLYLSIISHDVEGDAVFPPFEHLFEFRGIVLSDPDFEVRHYQRSVA
jgi:dihydrofolate reductase